MKNAIQELNEHCQKLKLPFPDWICDQVSVTPSEWCCTCKLDEYTAKWSATTKQEAKSLAAAGIIDQLITEGIWWEQLQRQNTKNINRGQSYRKTHKFNTPH